MPDVSTIRGLSTRMALKVSNMLTESGIIYMLDADPRAKGSWFTIVHPITREPFIIDGNTSLQEFIDLLDPMETKS